MFAVIKTGGKQYRVAGGSVLKIEKMDGEPGSQVEFNEVLMIGSNDRPIIIGSPLVKGALVTAEILSQTRDTKVIVFKKQRRQHYRRKNGHRQSITHVLIKDIKKI